MEPTCATLQSMANKYLSPSEIGKHITKLQNGAKDAPFAATLGITRQSLRTIKAGGALPNVRTRSKLGLELVYRVVDPVNEAPSQATATATPTPKAAAKKTANNK